LFLLNRYKPSQEIHMFSKLIVGSTLLVSMSAFAAPDWTKVAEFGLGVAYLDRSSVAVKGNDVSVRVLRNYDQLVTLGTDPETKEAWYPHRSVKLQYVANCESGKVALEGWQMFSGNFGDGDTVWADRQFGSPMFVTPSSSEESSALSAACSTRAANASMFGTRSN
jgi:hypothetical protein